MVASKIFVESHKILPYYYKIDDPILHIIMICLDAESFTKINSNRIFYFGSIHLFILTNFYTIILITWNSF